MKISFNTFVSFLLIYWVTNVDLFCQNETADSIKAVLLTQSRSPEKGNSYVNLSSAYIFQAPDSAVFFGEKAIEIGEEFEDTEIQRKAYFNIAAAYATMEVDIKAISYFKKSLNFMDKISDRRQIVSVQINLGAMYLKLDNFQESEQSFQAALELMDEETPDQYYKVIYNNQGIICEGRKEFDKAREYYLQAQEYTAEEDVRSWGLSYGNLGDLARVEGDNNLAKKYYKQGIAKLEGSFFHEPIIAIYDGIAGIYIQEENWKDAARHLDSMDVHCAAYGVASYQNLTRKSRSAYLNGIGEEDKAYQLLAEYAEVQDSLHAEERKTELLRLQTELELESKEIEVSLLEEEKEEEAEARRKANQFSWLLGLGLCLIAGISIILIFTLRARTKEKRQLAHQNSLIEEKNNQLEKQKETMESLYREKDGLIGIVAHDLKSPLNKGLALLSMIRETGSVNPAQENAIRLLSQSNQTGLQLIEDLLELNSVDQGEHLLQKEKFKLNDLLAEIGGTFQGESSRKGIALAMIVEPLDLEMESNPMSIARILENLISNAFKFSQAGTGVKVTAQQTGQSVTLEVRDQGPGISPEDQQKLFAKFQRLSAQPTGGESSTGLGLAIVKGLVDKLEGSIQVTSKIGEGTAFIIELPR